MDIRVGIFDSIVLIIQEKLGRSSAETWTHSLMRSAIQPSSERIGYCSNRSSIELSA